MVKFTETSNKIGTKTSLFPSLIKLVGDGSHFQKVVEAQTLTAGTLQAVEQHVHI